MPYAPLPDEPWPADEGWFLVVWHDESERWYPTQPKTSREEAVAALRQRRGQYPDEPCRLVRETRTYTTETD